ncbi:MAG: tetratricopeptide repeat protein [Polyangiaceae bacterium]|nr:tetratricopeptide repeat protein [Polyangiaceae bacterium]
MASPSDAAAQAALSAASLVRGHADEALEAARAAIARDPAQPIALYVLARLALEARPAEAEAYLTRLFEGGRDGYDVRLLAARAALARREVAGAEAHLRAATRLSPLRAEAWQALEELAERSGNADARVEALRALVDIDEHGREVHAELLDALVARGDYEEAVRLGERALYVDPGRAEGHLALGRALLETREPSRALFEYESATLADPRVAGRAGLGKARALLALGRRRPAEEAARAAVAADPSLEEEAGRLLAR